MLLSLLLLARSPSDPGQYVQIRTLAKGVFAAVRNEPPGLAVDSNVLFIERARDLVMVDANIGPESVTATLAAIAKFTKKPVGAVIATHYHDDHMGGVATVRARFPKVALIAHRSSPAAIQKLLKPARAEMIEMAPQMGAFLQKLSDEGKSFGGGALSDEERKSYANDIRIANRYAKEMPKVPLPAPTKLVDDRLVLKEGGRTIEILHLGAGHTPSDLVVWLPKEKVVAVGDLVVWPVPLVGGPQSDVIAWPSTLARVRALKPRVILPGHGPLMENDRYLRSMEAFFRATVGEVRNRLQQGETVDQAQKSIKLEEMEGPFCGGSQLRKVLFDQYARLPSIASAYRLLSK